jgi:hypothetical protein
MSTTAHEIAEDLQNNDDGRYRHFACGDAGSVKQDGCVDRTPDGSVIVSVGGES